MGILRLDEKISELQLEKCPEYGVQKSFVLRHIRIGVYTGVYMLG